MKSRTVESSSLVPGTSATPLAVVLLALAACHSPPVQSSQDELGVQEAARQDSPGDAGAQQDRQGVSQEEIEKFERAKKAANDSRIEENVAENQTGTDPRSFANQWAPYYRYTELENGLIQQDLTAFGVVGFTPRVGMFYEVTVAQYRDFSDVTGFPPGSDAIGLGDTNLKFLLIDPECRKQEAHRCRCLCCASSEENRRPFLTARDA